jgi:hypothetical protein
MKLLMLGFLAGLRVAGAWFTAQKNQIYFGETMDNACAARVSQAGMTKKRVLSPAFAQAQA